MPPPRANASRLTVTVNSRLNQRLTAYVAAASAAGGMLALAPSAEAKVVYTPANTVVTSTTPIDLNHDGIADFTLALHEFQKAQVLLVDPQVTGNSILLGPGGAAAGFFGVPVGPGEKFGGASQFSYSWGVFMARFSEGYSTVSIGGPWANTTNRYLGLKFTINGQTHFGWARLNVSHNHVLLTGYAYETTPNKTIIEGHISGPEKADMLAPPDLLAPPPQRASLGMLARGADSLAIWRREEESVTR